MYRMGEKRLISLLLTMSSNRDHEINTVGKSLIIEIISLNSNSFLNKYNNCYYIKCHSFFTFRSWKKLVD